MANLRKKLFLLVSTGLFCAICSAPLHAQAREFVPNEVLVKFKATIQSAQALSALTDAGLNSQGLIEQIGVYHCSITNSQSVHAAVEACLASPLVEYAEPNYIYAIPQMTAAARETPDDPSFDDLWGLHNSNDADIDAPEAWEVQKGNRSVIVAIIDTGIDYEHEDLRVHIWRNAGESGDGKENNGLDDDNNGYVDDWRGWNFERDSNDPLDAHGHGTHVAGTVGAVGNNGIGVVGVNWQVTLMPLRFIGADGFGEADDAIRAILYAADNGARVLSNSWGGDPFMQSMEDAIRYARDKNAVFVAAAGNDDRDNDLYPHYPSNYRVENVLAVAASNASDGLANFSNFGKKLVHLSAPGVNILSTFGRNGYSYLSGTSMATPHVSGVAALLFAQFPEIGYREVILRTLGSVDRKSSHSNFVVTGGRLNAFEALTQNPVVGFVTEWRDTLFTEGPYPVDAEVVDADGIAALHLYFAIDGGAQQQLAMQNVGAHRFRASIPGQPHDASIAYFVQAENVDGERTRSRVYTFKIAEPSGGGGCGCSSAGSVRTARASAIELGVYLTLLIGIVRLTGRKSK